MTTLKVKRGNYTSYNVGTIGDTNTWTGQNTFTDSLFSIADNTTPSKIVQFQCSGISASTTRTFTFPDANTTIVGTDVTQTLTNKTLGFLKLSSPTELTITGGGQITVTQSLHTLQPFSGTADDLDTINGGSEGIILILKTSDSGDTITVKDGTGNIQLQASTDFGLANPQSRIGLIYDGTNWVELFRSNNA